MQFSTVVVAFLAAATNVSGKCFKSGIKWADSHYAAVIAADRVCTSGQLAGNYTNRETKYVCQWLDVNTKAELSVRLNVWNTHNLSPHECAVRLKNEIIGCERGGKSMIGNFTFTYVFTLCCCNPGFGERVTNACCCRADPNDGFCP